MHCSLCTEGEFPILKEHKSLVTPGFMPFAFCYGLIAVF